MKWQIISDTPTTCRVRQDGNIQTTFRKSNTKKRVKIITFKDDTLTIERDAVTVCQH